MSHPPIRLAARRVGERSGPTHGERATPERAVPGRHKKGNEEHKKWLVVVWLNLLERLVKDRRLVFTSTCSGAREDPPELGRLIPARRCLDSARLSLVSGLTQREDHTK